MTDRAALNALGVREVTEGVYKLGTRWVNYYLVAEADEYTLIDAGYPRYWKQLTLALEALGSTADAVRAVLVTHHHVDHAGTAEQLRSHAGSHVFVGEPDAARVRGEKPSHPPSGFYTQAWRPSMLRYLAHTVAAGGARYRPVREVASITERARLDVPGQPTVIPTSGHTVGHYSVALESRGVFFAGDAMVNFDYASGRTALGLHRFNEDRAAAAAALGRLDELEADLVLFGHGEPWTDGLRAAVDSVCSEG